MKTKYVLSFLIIFIFTACKKDAEEEIIRPVKIQEINSIQNENFNIDFPAQISPTQKTILAFKYAGKIKNINFESGDFVKKGQVIATMDNKDYMVNLEAFSKKYEAAKAVVQNAEVQFSRAEKLYKGGALAKKDYDNVIAEDDIVTIYGLAMGRTTYETIFHSSVTLPYMQGLIYEVHTEETEENFVTKELYNSDGLKIEQIKNGTLRFYNNSSQKVRVRPESIDVEGQKLNEYSLDLREELQPGQFVDGDINDSEGLLKAGKVINIILKVTNDDYEEITQINISVKLEKDIVN